MRPFFWLASYPKSGNTWLRLFLGAYLNDGPVNINSLPVQVTHSDLKPYHYYTVAPRPLNQLSDYDVLALRGAALQHLACMGQWPLLVKTHHARLTIDGIQLIPPMMTEGAIYIVRDPRDVAVSFAHHLGVSVDHIIGFMSNDRSVLVKDNHKGLSHAITSWSRHVDSWMRFEATLIKYEHLLEGPNSFVRAVNALGWDLDESRVERAIEATEFAALQQQEQRDGFSEASNKAERFFREGKASWKDALTVEQAKQIENDHGEVMEALGYL